MQLPRDVQDFHHPLLSSAFLGYFSIHVFVPVFLLAFLGNRKKVLLCLEVVESIGGNDKDQLDQFALVEGALEELFERREIGCFNRIRLCRCNLVHLTKRRRDRIDSHKILAIWNVIFRDDDIAMIMEMINLKNGNGVFKNFRSLFLSSIPPLVWFPCRLCERVFAFSQCTLEW